MRITISVTQDAVRVRYVAVALSRRILKSQQQKHNFCNFFLAKTSIITKTIIIIGIIIKIYENSS